MAVILCAIQCILISYFMLSNLYLFSNHTPLICPLSLSLLITTHLLCLWVCFTYMFIWILFYISHINYMIEYFSFFVWLISLTMTLSKSIHVSSSGTMAFLFKTEWYSTVCVYIYLYTYYNFFIHLSYPFFCWWMFVLLPYLRCYK